MADSLDEHLRTIVREELDRFAERLLPRSEQRREWLSMTELAAELAVGLPVIHKMMERGCPHIKPDSRPRFNLPQVTTWLANNKD